VPAQAVKDYGLASITNLIVRRKYGDGTTIALNAHGDVVPPGDGWTHDPYGGEIADGKLYARASAVSKSDFASYTFAVRALESLGASLKGGVELHFTYDEEFGGELGPGWLLKNKLTRPDFLLAAGFSYQVINAHNGCLQMEVTVNGKMAHAGDPTPASMRCRARSRSSTRCTARTSATSRSRSSVPGINHPYLNVGRIEGRDQHQRRPGKVVLKLDRRMIPEENPADGRGRCAGG
jgi:acetylornithine deacetylase/succinyl-diaminopimelate desuccinylase-like protein